MDTQTTEIQGDTVDTASVSLMSNGKNVCVVVRATNLTNHEAINAMRAAEAYIIHASGGDVTEIDGVRKATSDDKQTPPAKLN